jgi:transposase
VNEACNPYLEYSEKPEALISMLIEKDGTLAEKDFEIAKLQRLLWQLQKAQFGTKSEKISLMSGKQLVLLADNEVQPPAAEPAKISVPAHTRAARTKRDLSKLPHNRIVHEPEDRSCSCCGEEMAQIGEDISKELEYQPAKLFVNEHVRPRFACNKCKEGGVLQAKLPPEVKPLNRSIAGAGLLTQIIVGKYIDHLPLHRQEQIFARRGFEIPRKSMCDWTGGVVDEYLSPLWHLQRQDLFCENYLQADETTLKVQDGEIPGKCSTGYLWGMYSPEKNAVFFEYADSRAGAAAKEIFKGFKGTLQTDAYAGYNQVLLPDSVRRIACLAHVRRKFIDAEKVCSKEATVVLTQISELYHLHNQWRALDPPERQINRETIAKPKLLKLGEYLRALAERTLPKAPLMEAIKYTLNQWDEIVAIFDDERFQLDNNPIERQMRPIAIGRKNYLFAGSHEGASRAAIIYSLLGTAKLHKVNPEDWLKYVLQNMRTYPVARLKELLPQNWKL